jgi:modulator of FtsH protease
MEGWTEFFLGEVGATAAIAGLFNVAITINIERILQSQFLPGRAALTLLVIGAAMTLSGLALFPRQPLPIFGWEAIATGVIIAASGIRHAVHAFAARGKTDPLWWSILPLILILICAAPLAIGGGLLVADARAGMYWVASGILVAMATTLITGWVLLVEILR